MSTPDLGARLVQYFEGEQEADAGRQAIQEVEKSDEAAQVGDAYKVAVALDDFRAYMPDHKYIFVPNGELWPASSVDARVQWPEDTAGKPMRPSAWLDQHRPVEQMVWS